MAATCRFCLDSEETLQDPLIAPCECTGTVRWVHRNCLRKWFIHSDIPEYAQMCQLCRAPFHLPRQVKLEHSPRIVDDGVWYFLSRPYPLITLLYVFHAHLCARFPQIQEGNYQQHAFFALLFLYTSVYGAYYIPYFKQINNKRKYLSYWRHMELTRDDYTYNPLSLLAFSALNLCACFQLGPVPFGGLYVWALPKYLYVHRVICLSMNLEE